LVLSADSTNFVSEYRMPEDKFVAVWEKPHRSCMGAGNNTRTVEKLFRPRNQID